MKRTLIFILLLGLSFFNAFAQLGSKHWLPPIHSRSFVAVEDHYIYLSTPSVSEFEVTLQNGNTITTTAISAGNPARIYIDDGKPSPMFTSDFELNSPSNDKGFTLTGSEEFYASFRVRAEAHAGHLTTKGAAALGTSFRLGSIPQNSEVDDKNFFTSIMATEDNTLVTLSEFDEQVVFEGPNAPTGPITITLNSEETYTVSGYTNNPSNYDGFIGALVTSDKPIVVNTGNALGGFATRRRDYAIDQIVPIDQIGDEYILVEGNGNSITERPMVIATEANTEIFVNGNLYTTLENAGDYSLIENSNYQGTTHRNMYVSSSKNVYMYQFLAGDDNIATVGMNFIPPLSCFFQKEVDLIPAVDKIGTYTYEGDIIAITREGAIMTVNGTIITKTPEKVLGNSDWVTYRLSGYSGDVAISSTGALAVGLFGYNGNAGFGGYYSGFGAIPKDTEIKVCDLVSTDLFEEVLGNPDPGGVWTDPNGNPHNGIFDPSIDLVGIYNYYLFTDCEVIDIDVTVKGIVAAKDAGLDNSIIICVEESPFDLITQVLGTPDSGGDWRDPDGAIFDGILNPDIAISGIYTYGFYDNPPCETVEASIDVTISSAPLSIEAVLVTPVISNNTGIIKVNTIGGVGDYEFQLDNGIWQNDNIFEGVPNGGHLINVRDKNGCGSILTDTITTIIYPSFFTPNGDNINETWNIEDLDTSLEAVIYIYNKYGKLLKQINPYEFGWDGLYLNNRLPSSDYWFQMLYTEDKVRKSFNSHFSLKR